MTLIAADLDTTVIEELDEPWQCQGEYHKRGLMGHDPEAPAAWLLIAPCCAPMRILICEPRRQHLLQSGLLHCSICAKGYIIEQWHLEPIGK